MENSSTDTVLIGFEFYELSSLLANRKLVPLHVMILNEDRLVRANLPYHFGF